MKIITMLDTYRSKETASASRFLEYRRMQSMNAYVLSYVFIVMFALFKVAVVAIEYYNL